MGGRASALALAFFVGVVFALFQGTPTLLAAVPESKVEFQDGSGNAKESFSPGDTAAFYVRDASLSTMATSTAIWTELTAQVAAGTWWSLATGAPDTSTYELIAGTRYDTSTPANTPLSSKPTATVNEVTPYTVTNFTPLTGELRLLNNVNASSTLRVDFTFDVVDSFLATQHRAKVTSTSDTDGEWLAISEETGETDPTPSATSSLYRGQVLLSGDAASSASGDGSVWVQAGDVLTVGYYGADGVTVIDTYQADVVPAMPTPMPAAGWIALVLLAGVFALVIAQRRWGRPPGIAE